MNVMDGFRVPTNYNAMMGAGAPMPMSSYTGQPDYMSALTPSLGGVDMGQVPTGQGGGGNWGSGIQQYLQESGILGSTDMNGIKSDGWGSLALGAASGLMNGFMGMKSYGLAKKTLAQNEKQFNLNFGAQQKTTNAQLEDRQRARVASNPNAYVPVADYMKKNGI